VLASVELPDIKKKIMPININIILQQGATAPLPEDDPLMKAKVEQRFGDKSAVKLHTQPAQAPDLNVNDLGFFNSPQSMCYRTSPEHSIELIEMVEHCFKNYPVN
jgi:hypothetical protein